MMSEHFSSVYQGIVRKTTLMYNDVYCSEAALGIVKNTELLF